MNVIQESFVTDIQSVMARDIAFCNAHFLDFVPRIRREVIPFYFKLPRTNANTQRSWLLQRVPSIVGDDTAAPEGEGKETSRMISREKANLAWDDVVNYRA